VCHTQGPLYVGLCQQSGDNQHDGIKVGRGIPQPPGDPWPPAVGRTNYWLSAPTGTTQYLPGPARPLSDCSLTVSAVVSDRRMQL